MPFSSLAQLRTCYGSKRHGHSQSNFNCKEFLKNTNSVCCLPERVSQKPKCKKKQKDIKRTVSKVKTGPRGGRYKMIREYDKKSKKLMCEKKIYVQN